jgi:hypothetical protein
VDGICQADDECDCIETGECVDGRFQSATIQIGTSLWQVHAINANNRSSWRLYKLSVTGTSPLFTFSPAQGTGLNCERGGFSYASSGAWDGNGFHAAGTIKEGSGSGDFEGVSGRVASLGGSANATGDISYEIVFDTNDS